MPHGAARGILGAMLPVVCLVLVLAAPTVQDSAPGQETLRLVSPSGEVLAEGPAVAGQRHGRWRHRHPGGEVAAVGPYKNGRRTGNWTFHRSDGSKLATGKFEDGLPAGRWQVFQLDGKPDKERTGDVEAFDVRVPGSALRAFGQRLDGALDGPVCVLWPNGVVFLELTFERGVLVGAPRLQSPTGTVVVMRGEHPTLVEHDAARYFGFGDDGLPRATFQELGQGGDGSWTGSARVAAAGAPAVAVGLMEQVLAADPALDPNGLVDQLGVHAPNVLALALEELIALGVGQPLTPRAEALVTRVVEPLTPGFALGFDAKAKTLEAAPLGVALTALALFADRPGYFALDVRLAPERRPLGARLDKRVLQLPFDQWCRAASRDKKGEGAASPRPAPSPFAGAFPSPKSKDALRERLRACHVWLAAAQRPDGLWNAAPPDGPFDTLGHELGVTALALSALLQSDSSDPKIERAIVAAIRALLAAQDLETGRFARAFQHSTGRPVPFAAMYEHMLVTEALATVMRRRGSISLEIPVHRAAHMLAAARNRYGGFGYEPLPSVRQDTSITYWGARALVAAERIGWRPRQADDWREFVLQMVGALTDPTNGRVGYDSIGSISARAKVNEHFERLGEPMTAAGIWLVHTCASEKRAAAFTARSEGLLRANLPKFDASARTNDMYYWLLGTQAYRRAGGPGAVLWGKALIAAFEAALAASSEPGSIDPIGPWGMFGGRAYSTAALALAIGEMVDEDL